MADLSAIKLPNGITYTLKDKGALPLTGGAVTGPVTFGDSISIDDATIGSLVVNGSASFTNNVNVNTINSVAVGSSPKFTDTTYSSKTAASGGTDVSLVTTGEKYTWNNKSNLTIGTTATTAAAGNHTHTASLATDTGTSSITLASAGKYKLTTGGSSVIFTMPTIPVNKTTATSSTTGISISNHSTGSVTGVQSSTTTASKVTLGTAISVPNVTSVGSASTWTFEEKTIPNVTAAGSGSFTQGSFSGGSLTFAIDSTDNKQLNITFTAATHGADSHTHTAPTLGTAIKVQSKSGGGNGSAPTLGTAKSIPNVTGVSDVTVPIKNTSATTVVTSATHTVTDNGHTHSLS